MPDFDREHASRHFDDGCIVKGLRKTLRVDRRRRDDDLEIGATLSQRPEITEEKVDIQGALVGFVDDESVVFEQIAIRADLGQ